MQFINANWRKIALSTFAFMLPVIPQLIYWKSVTGSLIFLQLWQPILHLAATAYSCWAFFGCQWLAALFSCYDLCFVGLIML